MQTSDMRVIDRFRRFEEAVYRGLVYPVGLRGGFHDKISEF